MLSRAALTLLLALTACAPSADDDPWAAPPIDAMAPQPITGRDLTAADLFTVGEVTADEALTGAFRPRADRPAHAFGDRIDWDADPYADENWRFHLLALRVVDPLILGWEATGDPRYLDRAAMIALDWVNAHPAAPARKTDPAWHDMTTGLRALRLAWLHDRWAAGEVVLAPEAVVALEGALDQHRIALTDPGFWRLHNHTLYALHGLAAACRARAEAPTCARERAYAREGLLRVLRGSYAPDGGHKEHSPKYHDFVLRTLERMVATGWYDLPEGDAATLAAASDVSPWMADAFGLYPNIGDSERDPNRRAAEAPGAVPGCEGAGCAALLFLPETGYAVLKTALGTPDDRRASLFLTCARHSAVHKHLDSLSFEWADHGRYLLVDGGKLHYDDDAARRHLLSRAAHNTASLEGGDGYQPPMTGGCLETATLADGVMSAVGGARIGRNAIHRRRLRYAVGDELTVEDAVSGSSAWRLRWNLAPGLAATPHAGGYDVRSEDGALIMRVRLDPACAWSAHRGDRAAPSEGALTSEQYRQLQVITTITGRCPARTDPVVTRFALPGANGQGA